MSTTLMQLANLSDQSRKAIEVLVLKISEAEKNKGYGTFGLELTYCRGAVTRLRTIEETTFPADSQPQKQLVVQQRSVVKGSAGAGRSACSRLNL